MIPQTEPTIDMPRLTVKQNVGSIPAQTKQKRYAPERGLIRRLRSAQASDEIDHLAVAHGLDPTTSSVIKAELLKAGAPPITTDACEIALRKLLNFAPLNADALHPFLFLATDRTLRAHALAQIGAALHQAGRGIQLVSDAADAPSNPILHQASLKLGRNIFSFNGSKQCVDMVRKADLACLTLIEAGFRMPLDRIALLRLNTLIQSTGAEPVVVARPSDASLISALSQIGVKRVILAGEEKPQKLGPFLFALRKYNLSLAESLTLSGDKSFLSAAQTPSQVAEMLIGYSASLIKKPQNCM